MSGEAGYDSDRAEVRNRYHLCHEVRFGQCAENLAGIVDDCLGERGDAMAADGIGELGRVDSDGGDEGVLDGHPVRQVDRPRTVRTGRRAEDLNAHRLGDLRDERTGSLPTDRNRAWRRARWRRGAPRLRSRPWRRQSGRQIRFPLPSGLAATMARAGAQSTPWVSARSLVKDEVVLDDDDLARQLGHRRQNPLRFDACVAAERLGEEEKPDLTRQRIEALAHTFAFGRGEHGHRMIRRTGSSLLAHLSSWFVVPGAWCERLGPWERGGPPKRPVREQPEPGTNQAPTTNHGPRRTMNHERRTDSEVSEVPLFARTRQRGVEMLREAGLASAVAAVSLGWSVMAQTTPPVGFDVVIRNARVVDSTSTPGTRRMSVFAATHDCRGRAGSADQRACNRCRRAGGRAGFHRHPHPCAPRHLRRADGRQLRPSASLTLMEGNDGSSPLPLAPFSTTSNANGPPSTSAASSGRAACAKRCSATSTGRQPRSSWRKCAGSFVKPCVTARSASARDSSTSPGRSRRPRRCRRSPLRRRRSAASTSPTCATNRSTSSTACRRRLRSARWPAFRRR